MNLDEEERQFKKVALAVVLLVTALLVVLRFSFLGNGNSVVDVVASLVDNLVATLIAAIAVTLFIFYLGRRVARSSATFIRGKDLKARLLEDARQSHTWRIRARTGSYFVRETLPILPNDAVIDIVLMDPSRIADLATYQALRPAAEQENWNPIRVQADALVSIIRLIQHASKYPFTKISLFTTGTAWAQSLDISDNNSYLCGQSKGDLALVCPESDELYARFVEDFKAVSICAQHRALPKIDKAGTPTAPLSESQLTLFKNVFLAWFNIDVDEQGLKRMVIARSSKGHHYG